MQLAVNQLVVGSIPASGARTRDPVHVINGGGAVTIESAGRVVHWPSVLHNRSGGNALGEV